MKLSWKRHGVPGVLTLITWLNLLSAGPVYATDDEGELVNFAFATWLGTGVYKVADRKAAILNLPIYVPWQAAGKKQWGVNIRMPVSLGVLNFEQLPSNLETIAFIPGIELEIPLSEHWQLKPFAQIGFGKDFTSGESASIYGVGLKGLGVFPRENFTVSLGGGLLFAGSNPSSEGETHNFSKLDLGLDFRFPVSFSIRDRPTNIGVFVVGSYFVNDLDFPLPDEGNKELYSMLEVGASIGTEPRFSWWRFDMPRLGLSYLYGSGFDGLRVNLGFPF